MSSFTGAPTPNMLAVGKKISGLNAQYPLFAMQNSWDVRSGRTPAFAVWQDELIDALASLGLPISCINEPPPIEPDRSSVSAYKHNLWVEAMMQFQDEGTKLFDTVRPSLQVCSAYTQMDLRAISQMKQMDEQGVLKDGRALCRWALHFVDYSSLSYQIKLIAELNKKKIEVNASKVQFAMHMISLLEMWLQKEGTNIKEPAEYYQRLLMSMPTEPECALVRVRSKIADMVEENSPILQDLDGENGFFVRINSYAESQGVKEVELQGVKEEESRSYVREMGGLQAMQEVADQCSKCRSWICKRLAVDCICQHDSTYDIDKILPGPKKEFVELNRDYSKENPGASLLIEAYEMRRSLKGKPKTKPQGQLAHMGGVAHITAEDELDAWLAEHNCGDGGDGDGFFALGTDESPVRACDKTINESPLSTGNCKPNPSLDRPRPLYVSGADVAEKDASKGGGFARIKIVQYILRVALAGVGHVTTTASDLSEYCINLPRSQLATIALAVYAFHHKIKPTLRTLIELVASAYFKLGAGTRQRLRALFIKIKSIIAQRMVK